MQHAVGLQQAAARERFCSQARHWLTQPASSGASSQRHDDVGELREDAFEVHRLHQEEQRDEGEEAVEQVDRDAPALQPADEARDALGGRARCGR